MENSLARNLSIADAKAKYDENIKNILSDKEILAWILKNTTTEFADLSTEKIIKCIEDDPEISTVKVNPGETNAVKSKKGVPRKINGTKDEDKIPNEGTIFYDIRFYAYVPKDGKRIKIILNLEAQKEFYPGYQIVTRGVFYGGRMISAQLDTEFEIPDYDGLKKVYSIWICVDAPQYIGNAISSYSLEKKDIVTGIPDSRQAYDKLSIVMICLNEKMEKETEFLDMMNTLLSETKEVEQKKKELEEKFHIHMKRNLKEGLKIMCNLSDLVEERGIKKGRIRGMLEMLKEIGFSKDEASEQVAMKLEMETEDVYKAAEKVWM